MSRVFSLVLPLLVALVGCRTVSPPPLDQAGVEDLSWLIGDWVGKLGDRQLRERWSRTDGDDLVGTTLHSRKGVVELTESLRLYRDEGQGLVYQVAFASGKVTRFVLTAIDPHGFHAERQGEPDFPETIDYRQAGPSTIDVVLGSRSEDPTVRIRFERVRALP